MPMTAPALQRRLAALALLGATTLVAGCAGMSNPFGGSSGGAAQPAPRPVQVCNAASAQSFVGKSNTSATLEADVLLLPTKDWADRQSTRQYSCSSLI